MSTTVPLYPCPRLTEMLERNNSLETLNFCYYPIRLILPSIAERLTHNSALKELVLYESQLSDREVVCLSEMLKENTSLESLEIWGRNDLLPDDLKNVPNARYLNMEPLVEALAVNTTLKKLQLDWESFGLSGDVIEKLMANGVLLQLLMTTIEMTVREFGW